MTIYGNKWHHLCSSDIEPSVHKVKSHWLLLPLITEASLEKSLLPSCTALCVVRKTNSEGQTVVGLWKRSSKWVAASPNSSLQRSPQLWFPSKALSTPQGLQSPKLPSLSSSLPPPNCPCKSMQTGTESIKCKKHMAFSNPQAEKNCSKSYTGYWNTSQVPSPHEVLQLLI